MGKPYSMDLRERIVAYVEVGHSCRAAARLFAVSASTAVRLAAAHRERGDVSPKPQGRAPGTAGKLAPHTAFLLEAVRAEPGITRKELAGALAEARGVGVQLSSLHQALRRAGITVAWQRFEHPTYPQRYPELGFVQHLCFLDLLLNCGPESRDILQRSTDRRAVAR